VLCPLPPPFLVPIGPLPTVGLSARLLLNPLPRLPRIGAGLVFGFQLPTLRLGGRLLGFPPETRSHLPSSDESVLPEADFPLELSLPVVILRRAHLPDILPAPLGGVVSLRVGPARLFLELGLASTFGHHKLVNSIQQFVKAIILPHVFHAS
jgi:hypothetical protein